jgi:hypothetical protein
MVSVINCFFEAKLSSQREVIYEILVRFTNEIPGTVGLRLGYAILSSLNQTPSA